MKFKIGERARLKVACKSLYTPYKIMIPAGTECTITAVPGGDALFPEFYNVLCDGNPNTVICKEHSLQKLLPDSDTYHVGSWDIVNDLIKRPVTA